MNELYYEQQHTLLMRDCDMHRRLKPSAMLAMFQDCSEALTEGWGVGLDAMLDRGIIWVAARVECTVTRLPEHCETVTVRVVCFDLPAEDERGFSVRDDLW